MPRQRKRGSNKRQLAAFEAALDAELRAAQERAQSMSGGDRECPHQCQRQEDCRGCVGRPHCRPSRRSRRSSGQLSSPMRCMPPPPEWRQRTPTSEFTPWMVATNARPIPTGKVNDKRPRQVRFRWPLVDQRAISPQ